VAAELAKKVIKKSAKKARAGTRSRKHAATVRGSKAPRAASAEKTIRLLKSKLADARARIDELQAWADTDFLLNIYNRRGFERELARSIAYIKRYGATGALIVLDVDRLKPINDTYGHAAGDVVLKGVVEVLMRHIRSSDVVGRLGGDEFGLLLWNLTEADALTKAAALEDAIDLLTFAFKGQAVNAGASAGVALLGPMDDAAAILEQADRAMYERKKIRRSSNPAQVRR
jgi:diguanylate cyclase (GGDEF)-like protein